MTALPDDDVPMTRDEQAALWCMALADGHLGRDEQRAFDLWVADADNATAFEDAIRVWQGAELAADMPESIRARSAALESFRQAHSDRWMPRRSRRWAWAGGIAAMFAIVLIGVFLLHDPKSIYQTGIGERRVAMLDDGSKLSLDADTQVDVRLHKDRRELVLVHGRAKFDVARDTFRPFSVVAGDKVVVATGTSFSVELLGGKVHVLLYEGHVAVLDRTSDKPVPQQLRGHMAAGVAADQTLTPGRELIAPANMQTAASVVAIDPIRSLSWESGQLSFDDEPLPSAVERMNRYSRQKLVVGDQAIASVLVNGVFDAGDTESFVEGVTALNSVRVVRNADTLTLRRN